MSTHNIGRAMLALLAAASVRAQESPNLGVEISEQDLAAWNISIETDGTGLPAGSGTVESGERLYAQLCQTCHGPEGAGQPHDRLVGGQGTLTRIAQVRTIGSFWPYASTVFDYIRRAMPFNQPQSLSNDEVYALTAYLLYLNGIIAADEVMNARSLPRVVMPNSDGFVSAYPRQ